MKIEDVVMKLIGPVDPVGESNADERRLENLKSLCDLVGGLVVRIDAVGRENKGRYEASRHQAGTYAYNFLTKTLGIPG